MFVQLANMLTGEVVESRTDFHGKEFNPSLVAKVMRSHIRKWIKCDFIEPQNIIVINASSQALKDYFNQYTVELDKFYWELDDDEDEL